MSSPSAAHHPELFDSRDILDERHNQILERAVRNVLSTDIANLVYGQIIDGLPLKDTYNNVFPWISDHPVNLLLHNELCPGSLGKARKLSQELALSQFRFQERPLSAFQEAVNDSDQFKLRLVELVVVACHQIGAYLYELDNGTHPHSFYAEWERKVCEEQDQGVESRRYAYFPEIAFAHRAYQSNKSYPRGFADTAGYWAEGQLFGGVILFDRGESDKECRSMWIHCDERAGPSTLFPPTKEQFDALVRFLLAEPDHKLESPLPIKGTKANRPRWEPNKAFAHHHIFRDRYERNVPPEPRHRRDVFDAKDWPELNDNKIINMSALQQMDDTPWVTEEEVERARAEVWNITPTSPLWPQYLSMQAAMERYGNGNVTETLESPPT